MKHICASSLALVDTRQNRVIRFAPSASLLPQSQTNSATPSGCHAAGGEVMANNHRIEWSRTRAPACGRSRLCSLSSTLFLVGLLQITSGCAAARLTQFHNFAQAGTAYTKASQAVLDEAGTAAIEADSLIAQKGRDASRTAQAIGAAGGHRTSWEALAIVLRDTRGACRSEGPRDTGNSGSRRIRFHRGTESGHQERQLGRREDRGSHPPGNEFRDPSFQGAGARK